MRLENLKKLTHIKKTLSKLIKELQNLKKPVYTQRILDRLGKKIKNSFLPLPKVSAFIILADSSDFDSLYISCIVKKLIPITR